MSPRPIGVRAFAPASGLALGLGLLVAACASAPPESPLPAFDGAAAVAAIRAAGNADDKELVVRPLGDTEVIDLRERAAALETQGAIADAAAALDEALAITPNDPVLLQERAEAALLLGDLDAAERLARQAVATGTQVGPQCRQHWETIVQVLAYRQPLEPQAPMVAEPAAGLEAADGDIAAGPLSALEQARRQRDACTVAGVPRY